MTSLTYAVVGGVESEETTKYVWTEMFSSWYNGIRLD